MDDIMNALSQAMSDPATAAQVNGLLSALSGNKGEQQAPAGASPDMSGSEDMAKLMQIGTAVMQSGRNDPNIALITALRPLLKEETQLKADRAVKILRIMSAYPLLRDSGIF